jgi:predicted dehydrogenase
VAVADIKAAVVGAGWIATHGHLPGHKKAGANLVAIADVAPGLADKVAAEFGVPRAYADWREMLAREKPDVVSVCVPNAFHEEVVLGALEAGAHVLCEKPLAPSTAQAQRMFEAADRAGRYLMVAQNLRFRPVNQRVHQLARAGEFGRIYHAEAFYVRRLGIPTWGSFTQSRSSAGGAMLDIGVHVLDCALWFMGGPEPTEVSAQVESLFGTRPEVAAARGNAWDPAQFDVDDFASAFVRFANGATLSLQACWASHIERDREYVHVLGTDAGASNETGMVYRLRDGQKVDEALELPRVPGWEETVAHFLRVVDGQEHLQVLPEETLRVQRILDACYESARLGRAVSLRTGP